MSEHKIEFDPKVPIKKVGGCNHYCDFKKLNQGVSYLGFYDAKGKLFDDYNTENLFSKEEPPEIEHELGKNEQLIGIHGMYNRYSNTFSSLGFIVLQKTKI